MGVTSGASKWLAVPDPHVPPVVLLLSQTRYKISAKGHYVKLLRTKLYGKREGSILHRKLSIYMQKHFSITCI
jgi:hypothetical protein